MTGQAGALRLGVARALNAVDAEASRAALKKAGLLTRDARIKERKKAGLKKARKAPSTARGSRGKDQWADSSEPTAYAERPTRPLPRS